MRAGAIRCFSSRLSSSLRSCSVIRDESAVPRGGQDSGTQASTVLRFGVSWWPRRSVVGIATRRAESPSPRDHVHLCEFFSVLRTGSRVAGYKKERRDTDMPLSSRARALALTGRGVSRRRCGTGALSVKYFSGFSDLSRE